MKGVMFTDEDDLRVPPLSPAEEAWIKKLQKVLAECPKRLELVTMGDPSIMVVDAEGARSSELYDGRAHRDGVVLADLDGGPVLHGVS